MTTKITNVYNLKLTPSQFGQSSLVVNCSQYDSLYRVIQFNLFNGNAVYSIPEGSVVTIRGTKKDNTGFEYECDYSNNVVTFPLQQQITIFPGKVPAELRITNNGEIIGSWNFLFLVEESPLSDETIISETQLPLLEQAIEAADRLNEAFDDITQFTDETYPNAVQSIQDEGATQVANVTNEGTTQRGLVTSEGTTQIANVQAEGTTQVGNVQAKGTEVLDSIPSDYTELSGEVEDLKNALSLVNDDLGKTNIGNLIAEVITGTLYRYNSNTGEIYTQSNESYMCAVIDVSDIDFVTSTRNFGSTSFQFFGTDTTFIATGASCRTSDSGFVFAVPANATKLYISFVLSTWDIAVLEGKDDITSKTITDYPVGGTFILAEYDTTVNKTNIAYDVALATTTTNTQYLDNSLKETGYYYGTNGVKVENASYAVFPPVTVPKGTYYIGTGASANFSYVKIGNTFTKFSALNLPIVSDYQAYALTVSDEATLYISVNASNTYKVPVSTIPIMPTDDEYTFGNFLQCPYKVIYVGSTREYKTIKSALEAVEDVFDAYIYVDAEEFDLVQEFGQAYLDAYSTASSFGLFLKNRVHLIFASGSKVVFNYTGSNAIVHEWFSPFNAGRYGFEIVGLNIESANCRYSVHDEHGAENEPYRNIYKGCTMKHDSSATAWGAHQCIGGGLGLHGTVEIDGCEFTAIGTNVDASYHAPNTSANAQSRVTVKDSYFAGTFRMSTYGTGTAISHGYVMGNSMTAEPYVSHNTGAADNVEITAWNNSIRS